MMNILLRGNCRSTTRVIVALVAIALIAQSATAQHGKHALSLGVDTTNFDRSVRPQDDFFRFVNGGWITKTAIPGDASSWGAFNELSETSRNALRSIVEEAARTKSAKGTERQQVGDLYASYLDSARIESLGLTPLKPDLDWIATITSLNQLPAAFAHGSRLGMRNPMNAGVGPDQKNSRVNIVSVGQGGLGLPDRDYYLRNDPKLADTRNAYVTYITTLMTLASQPDPAGAASRIVALETEIAKVQWDRARQRDRNATYNRMTVADLAKLSPSFDWMGFFRTAGLDKATDVVVRQPTYVSGVDPVFANTPVATWREYLTFALLDVYANELPSAFQQARFDFRNRKLQGQQVIAARWKRGVDVVDRTLGEATGKLYVERNFKPEARARMDALVKNLRQAYQVGSTASTG